MKSVPEFKGRLRLLRKEKDVTQEDLAAAIGVSRTTVANWERGRRTPEDKNKYKAISSYFNVSLNYLLGESDYRNARELTPEELKKILPEFLLSRVKIVVDGEEITPEVEGEIMAILKEKGYL